MKKLYIFLLLLIIFSLKSQIITGKILSKEENKVIPYARIGIENTEIGKAADENGNFIFDVSAAGKFATVNVEVPGYEIYKTSLGDFIKQNGNSIYLTEKINNIQEVKISPKKYVERNWGNKSKGKSMIMGYNSSRLEPEKNTSEVAVLFKNNRKAKIEKININIPFMSKTKPVFVRFNVYDKNFNSVLNEDIFAEISEEQLVDNTFTKDISKYNVWMKEDFYVSLIVIREFSGDIYLSGALLGNKSFYRNNLNNWKPVPVINAAINIDVKVEK